MVTVIDPAGTPTPVYNRSGKTVVFISGGHASTPGGIGNDGTLVPIYSEHTIAVVAVSGSDHIVTFDTGAQVGDMVTVVAAAGSTAGPTVFPPVGESIEQSSTSTGTNTVGYGLGTLLGATFIKISSTNWQPF